MPCKSNKAKAVLSAWALALVLWSGAGCVRSASAEQIDNFDVTLRIAADASLVVTEKIDYDFGTLQKHGIQRSIPVRYAARNGNFSLRLNDLTVADAAGAPYAFTVSDVGENQEIKIGSADAYVTGKKTFVINYRVQRAINYFEAYDEVYWNATGNAWVVPIERASVQVVYPQPVGAGLASSRLACYAGVLGSQAPCATSAYDYAAADQALAAGAEFSASSLAAGEGLTVVVALPKGSVYQPTYEENLVAAVRDNLVLLLPLFVFGLMYYFWWTRGRDPRGRGTIIPQFEAPPGMTPAEVGTVVDERCGQKEIVAEIIYLATQGYLKLKRTENKVLFIKSTDYTFEKLKDSVYLPDAFDRDLLDSIFKSGSPVKFSDLKGKFYADYARLVKNIFAAVTSKGYFAENPQKVTGRYAGLAVVVFVLLYFLASFGVAYVSTYSFLALGLSALVVLGFSAVMPRKTERGVASKEYILGFKDYLTVAEKDRLEFHNAPAKSPEQFEKFLPYAIALGVEKAWAQQFEGIYNSRPSWYEDSTGLHAFSALALTHDLGSFSTAFASGAMTSAASGGSGFSGGGAGGGFGGGGGGSW